MSRLKAPAEDFLCPPTRWDITAAETRWNTRLRAKMTDLPACMVCSMEIECEGELRERDVQSIPNKILLTPESYHPAHELHEGMLLDLAAVREENGSFHGHVCNTCLRDLDDARPPVLSLANGSWIGPVPAALRELTLAEQTAIALHPHTTYHVSFKGDPALPTPFVRARSVHPMSADCMDPATTLPASMEVLDGAFDVCLPEKFAFNESSFGFLMMRRQKVLDALLWLKDHNHFYRQVMLSGERLREFPTRGVAICLLQRQAGKYEKCHDSYNCMLFDGVPRHLMVYTQQAKTNSVVTFDVT